MANRDAARGRALVQLINERTAACAEFIGWERNRALTPETDLLVNATSIGLYPDLTACPDLDLDSLRPELVVADVIPNPPRTALLQAASGRGCTVLDGLGMLVNQGRLAIRYWTGAEADAEVMRRALEQAFSRS
ncbi:shikimate dehydrogenase family protein [Marinobacterium aestuariivivens]|uniref:Shikimate dehydrogenase family protein n=1 Tax=Marinobacterium aestuariivivens TaxID=1698799 RepID=A0ABW2A634_9GAMM